MTEATHGITTGAVARRLGVSPTTLRSWDKRYGIGPEVRVDGRHRRWTPRDIAVLEEMCRLTASGVPPAEAARAVTTGPEAAPTGQRTTEAPRPARQPGSGNGLPLGDVRQECRGLARAAVRLDTVAMSDLLGAVLREHGLVTAWEDVMAPTLHAVGRKWESSGDRYVEVEHLLSWHVSSALRRVPFARHTVAPGAPPVLLACVPDEQHTLPMEALAAGLAELGLPTRMFGAAVPPEALDQAVRCTGPAAVVLWSQSRSTANRPLARHIAASAWGVKGARTHPEVLLAGPGWAGPPLPPLTRPGGLREALASLGRLYGLSPAAADPGSPAAPPARGGPPGDP